MHRRVRSILCRAKVSTPQTGLTWDTTQAVCVELFLHSYSRDRSRTPAYATGEVTEQFEEHDRAREVLPLSFTGEPPSAHV
jgi:hypothetical protein